MLLFNGMILPDAQLKELLLQSGLVDAKTIEDLLVFGKNSYVSLQDALIEKDIVPDKQLGSLIAGYLKLPFIVLSQVTIPEEILTIVPERLARKHKVISFGRDSESVHLAMADPTNTALIEMISKKTWQKVTPYFATERDIDNALQTYRKDLQQAFDNLVKKEIGSAEDTANEAPVVRIVDLLVTAAYRDKASDVHIEPEERDSLVRFRIDGLLHDALRLPKNIHERMISRIKILSRLRTDEHLAPQDGKMRIKVDDEELDIRVSILPIADGEKVVLRLLASRFKQFSLIDLGMNETDLKKVTSAYNRSYGMVLSTGPTGSGKTTSIYAILKILNTREKNITTIEDPIEYRIVGVNQIQTNTKTDLTFSNGLRSILRQDPNVVFVGEIRDGETAGIAVNAALTGHLVVSTLHTNDAATALPRLIDMKVEPFLVATTVNVIIAQRLVRKICDVCKAPYVIPRTELVRNLPEEVVKKQFNDAVQITAYHAKGCKLCRFTGYSGRIGIFEVLEVTKEIRKLIAEKNDSDVISRRAVELGMTTMLDDGLAKVAKGMTTIEEVLRVTKVESV